MLLKARIYKYLWHSESFDWDRDRVLLNSNKEKDFKLLQSLAEANFLIQLHRAKRIKLKHIYLQIYLHRYFKHIHSFPLSMSQKLSCHESVPV